MVERSTTSLENSRKAQWKKGAAKKWAVSWCQAKNQKNIKEVTGKWARELIFVNPIFSAGWFLVMWLPNGAHPDKMPPIPKKKPAFLRDSPSYKARRGENLALWRGRATGPLGIPTDLAVEPTEDWARIRCPLPSLHLGCRVFRSDFVGRWWSWRKFVWFFA